MGRIKTTLVKRNGKKLVGLYSNKFTADFTQNKVILKDIADIPSKKIRNIVAGYVTRLMKKQQ